MDFAGEVLASLISCQQVHCSKREAGNRCRCLVGGGGGWWAVKNLCTFLFILLWGSDHSFKTEWNKNTYWKRTLCVWVFFLQDQKINSNISHINIDCKGNVWLGFLSFNHGHFSSVNVIINCWKTYRWLRYSKTDKSLLLRLRHWRLGQDYLNWGSD